MITDEALFRKALSLIDAGVYVWRCPSATATNYSSFQSIAEAVVEAGNLGYIYGATTDRSSKPESLYHITKVTVHGGLTPKGRRRLSEYSSEKPVGSEVNTHKSDEIFIFQPNFYGIGLNLRSLLRKFKSRIHWRHNSSSKRTGGKAPPAA